MVSKMRIEFYVRWAKRIFPFSLLFLAILIYISSYSDTAKKTEQKIRGHRHDHVVVNEKKRHGHPGSIPLKAHGIQTQNEANPKRMSPEKSSKPHIVFILADDLGWHDVSYHGSEIRTPFIDHLAKEGVRLENYYVQATCTPSRASIMSGRYQSRNGLERVILPSEAVCLPTNLVTIPQILRRTGYLTHLVGKWHLGQSRQECLPLQRGFDTFLGFYSGAEDHFTHEKKRVTLTMPGYYLDGFDFREEDRVAREYAGKYSTHVFTERAQKIIANHSRNGEPMFLYLSLQAVHAPLQVPDSYVKPYEKRIKDEHRKLYAGLVACMDEGVKNLTNTLKQYGLWENTILIFSSDNGGEEQEGGRNYPLNGHKGQYMEGGIRVVGFVNSPLLSPNVRGTEYRGLMGGADWFPTMVEGIAGGSVQGLGLDGVDMWESIRSGLPSPRSEYLHAVGGNCEWHPNGPPNQRPLYGTIRVNEWKFRIGSISQKAFFRLPKTREEINNMTHIITLHDIEKDPYETTNLASSMPSKVQELLSRLREHCRLREPYAPVVERKESHPKYHNNVYEPWLKDGEDIEWHGEEIDRTRFSARFIEV